MSVAPDTAIRLAMPAPLFPAAGGSVPATATLVEIAPSRAELTASLPDAPPAEAPAIDQPLERLAIDDDLKPPIPRASEAWTPPAGHRGVVELDVRVDEDGAVSDAFWAGGSRDSVLIESAIASARTLRFWPALQAGRPIAVWCRQRFESAR